LGDATTNTDLSDFLSRPVRISTFSWLESTPVGSTVASFNPWGAWAAVSTVKNKLNNYSWLRGDLKLKIQITASPFYYGLLKASYIPLQTFTPSTIVNDAGTRYLMPYSQRPHLDIKPGHMDSYEMILPFIHPANWVNIQDAASLNSMGSLFFIIYSLLQSANGVTGTGISVTVFAWMENLQLSGASVGYAMQSESYHPQADEFGQGSVSRPASWLASAASYFESAPIIGPFATATRIGAGAVSAIASLFGFTNVPVIADSSPMRSEVFPKMASSEVGFPIERLTLDPKNELSIDPRIIGLSSGIDEMSTSYLAGRETWLCTAIWNNTDLIDQMLFYSRINPNIYDTDGGTNAKLYLSPMAFSSVPFDNWRGDIIYRFEIVASKYHMGKLVVSFDPTSYTGSNIGNTVGTTNIVQTAIIDIGETCDFEFRIPYQQATQFLTLRPLYDATNKGWATRTSVPGVWPASLLYDNGLITVRVLNALTAPALTAPVDVHIYVRAADNIEYANPTASLPSTFSTFAPQSEDLTVSNPADKLSLGDTQNLPGSQYLVHFGENIRSHRQLLRRYELHSIDAVYPSAVALTRSIWQKGFYKMPTSPGYSSTGYSTAGKIIGVGTTNYNYCASTWLALLSQAYVAYRGSINWSFNVEGASNTSHLRVYKDNISGALAGLTTANYLCPTASKHAFVITGLNSGLGAQALTNQNTQSGINVQCPMFTQFKFQSTNTANSNAGIIADGSILDRFVLEGDFPFPSTGTTVPTIIHNYSSIGTDFGLYYFLNVPTIYVYSSQPPPL
jgi:hypothetical protein